MFTLFAAGGLHFDQGMPWAMYFMVFLAILFAVLLREHFKLQLSGFLFCAMSLSAIFLSGNTVEEYIGSFANAKTIAGFSFIAAMFLIYEYCGHSFLASGVAERIAQMQFLRRNFTRRLAWITFFASAFVDNVAAAKMAKKIAQKRYGRKTLLPDTTASIICASNAGGAWSPVGDTTTIMITTSVLVALGQVWLVFLAIPACIAYQFVINSFLPKEEDNGGDVVVEKATVHWVRLLPLLAVPGLVTSIIVSAFLPQDDPLSPFLPLIGLVGGFTVGVLAATYLSKKGDEGAFVMEWHVLTGKSLLVNVAFILFLLGSAHMLPVTNLVNWMAANAPDGFMPEGFSYILGYLSAYFDNIPLTEAAILMGGLTWHRLAFLVGVGGSMTWSGSSAGVNVTIPEKEERPGEAAEAHPDEGVLYEAGDSGTEGREEMDPARDIRVWFGKGGWHYKGWLAMTVGFAVDLMLYTAILGIKF
jgi:Na+/H+ antiporter NhaD/arsenite permease-like protein